MPGFKIYHSFVWIWRALLVLLTTAVIMKYVDPIIYRGITVSTIVSAILLCVISVLLFHELYHAWQYRVFDKLYDDLMELNSPLFTNSMYVGMTEEGRDELINSLVALSDRKWDKFIAHCESRHYFSFAETDKDIIKDIEMLRALKD